MSSFDFIGAVPRTLFSVPSKDRNASWRTPGTSGCENGPIECWNRSGRSDTSADRVGRLPCARLDEAIQRLLAPKTELERDRLELRVAVAQQRDGIVEAARGEIVGRPLVVLGR